MDMTLSRDELPARTGRFLRELEGTAKVPVSGGDDDVRYWRRIGAMFGVAGAGVILSLLLWAGIATSGAGAGPSMPLADAGPAALRAAH